MLGHVQRGAMPTAEDRLLAAALGVRAVDLLAAGKADRMVAWWNRQVIDVPLEKVVGRSRTVDRDGALIRTALNFTGRHNHGFGYGALNTAGFVNFFPQPLP